VYLRFQEHCLDTQKVTLGIRVISDRNCGICSTPEFGPLYFAKERPVVRRGETLIMVDDERLPLAPGEKPELRRIRFRTLGCYPLTGAIESNADTVEAIVAEMRTARLSERQGRPIDSDKKSTRKDEVKPRTVDR
jgi:3'-phosphoadenosine 5'-phosphosulfate sulfotransferase (PAPS reductase)/FAD synthetase